MICKKIVRRAEITVEVARSRQEQYADKTRKQHNCAVGQHAWLSTKNMNPSEVGVRKLMRRNIGPFTIVEMIMINDVVVRLDLPTHEMSS